jgi:hypothetical protein
MIYTYDVDLVLSVNNLNLTFKITLLYLKEMEIMETGLPSECTC